MRFDNPAAYHNPSRDPAPSHTFFGGGAEGVDLSGADGSRDGLHIAAQDLEPAMEPYRVMHLSKHTVEGISNDALAAGFGEADHQHFYSRTPKDGLDNPVVRAAASYLIDGVFDVNEISRMTGIESMLGNAGLDWITKGTCNAGDIRVRFESRRLPEAVSMVAKQINTGGGAPRLVPHTYSNGLKQIFLQRGVMDLADLLHDSLADVKWSTNMSRIGAVLIFALGGLFAGLQADAQFGLVFGVCAGGVSWAVSWAMFYGVVAASVPLIAAAAAAAWWMKAHNAAQHGDSESFQKQK